jgi:hypothetical protein
MPLALRLSNVNSLCNLPPRLLPCLFGLGPAHWTFRMVTGKRLPHSSCIFTGVAHHSVRALPADRLGTPMQHAAPAEPSTKESVCPPLAILMIAKAQEEGSMRQPMSLQAT